MMIEDISGGLAVFEYVDGGKPMIYHGRHDTVRLLISNSKTLNSIKARNQNITRDYRCNLKGIHISSNHCSFTHLYNDYRINGCLHLIESLDSEIKMCPKDNGVGQRR
jgi:hypothetical protein